jgi:general secretion pathway protein K
MSRASDEPVEQGFALVLVLWGLLLLAALGANFLLEARATRILATSKAQASRARLLADAAINRAIIALLEPRDALQLRLDGSTQFIRLFDRDIELRVESEAGKVDLNAAPPSLLAALFRSQDVAPDSAELLAARVVAWRTPSVGNARREATAPYRDSGRSYGPRFGPFRSLGELRLVLGMTASLQGALAPLVTVWSGDGAIDRGVASGSVLRALELGGDPRAAGQRAARDLGQAAGTTRAPALGEAVTISASLRLVDMAVERVAVIQLGGDRHIPYRVLAWH